MTNYGEQSIQGMKTLLIRNQGEMKMKSIRMLMTVLVVMCSFFFLTVDMSGAEVGVKNNSIKVGQSSALSGHIAFIGTNVTNGVRLYIQSINDQGGINGRKIKLIVEDDQYKPPMTVASAKKLLTRDKIFAFTATIGTPCTAVLVPITEKKKVPHIGPLGNVSSTSYWRYTFPNFYTYYFQARLITDFIMNDLKATTPTIGVICQDDEIGRDFLKGYEKQRKLYGLKPVVKQIYKRGSVDFSSQVVNLKRAKCDHVVLVCTTREPAPILKEARNLDFHPVFIGSIGVAADKVIELAEDDAKGMYCFMNQALPNSDTPGMTQWRKNKEKFQPKARGGFYNIWGYHSAMIMAEGIKRAGKDLTREGLVKALETFRNWESGGIMSPVTYKDGYRESVKAGYFLITDTKNLKWIKYTDWREPREIQ